jgi:hypothetical protein
MYPYQKFQELIVRWRIKKYYRNVQTSGVTRINAKKPEAVPLPALEIRFGCHIFLNVRWHIK